MEDRPDRPVTGERLIVGLDPLCGWCFGILPALRALAGAFPDLPQHPVMSGLVTGERVGPYAEMEGYIRGASERLRAVTGRAPSQAFFDLIRRPGVVGDSAPPGIAIAHVVQLAPERAMAFADAVIEAHFEEGRDLNRPDVYRSILGRMQLDPALPDLGDAVAAERAWREGRGLGIAWFPTLIHEAGDRRMALPAEYDPARLVAAVARVRAEAV